MALQINNFTGFETQGPEESSSVTSDAYDTTNPRSGSSALSLNAATDIYDLPWVADGVTDAGTSYVFGFAFRKSGNDNANLLTIQDDSNAQIITVFLNSDGTVDLQDAAFGVLDSTAALNNDQWYYIEVYAELNSASGAWEWFLDGVSQGSDTGADLTDGNAFGTATSRMRFAASSSITVLFDDVYILSGASSASDRLGGSTISEMPEVFMYQNDIATSEVSPDIAAITGASDLNTAGWGDAAETPGDDNNLCAYTDTTARSGCAYADGGSRAGPSGDSNIDGDANIVAWKGIWRGDRAGGGASTWTIYMGNDADSIGGFDNRTVTLLNGNIQNFELLGEIDPPLSTENFAQGIGKNGGGRDWRLYEMWATLLHVPNKTRETLSNLSDGIMGTQNSFEGPFEI